MKRSVFAAVTALAVVAASVAVATSPTGATVTESADRLERRVVATTLAPPPYVWLGPIPTAPNGGRCTREQATVITSVFAAYGASFDTQVFFLLVAGRESGCQTSARNYSPSTGDDSFSWCQANAAAGHFGPSGILAGFDYLRCAAHIGLACSCRRLLPHTVHRCAECKQRWRDGDAGIRFENAVEVEG